MRCLKIPSLTDRQQNQKIINIIFKSKTPQKITLHLFCFQIFFINNSRISDASYNFAKKEITSEHLR